MTVQRILFVRHGETDYNVAHRWQGQLDVPLNDTGRAQATALATYLAQTPIDLIYSSDLKRAFDTAKVVAMARKQSVIPEPRLREIHLGIFQGLTREQLREQYPLELMQWDTNDEFVVQGGESRRQLRERAAAAWEEITASAAKTLLLLTHGGTMRVLLPTIVPELGEERWRFPNTSITILERATNSRWRVLELGTTPHLDSGQ